MTFAPSTTTKDRDGRRQRPRKPRHRADVRRVAQHRPPRRHVLGKTQPDVRQRRLARMNAGSSSVACTSRYPAHAGSRCRADDSPGAGAQRLRRDDIFALALGGDDAAHAAGDKRPARRARRCRPSATNTVDRRQHQRQHRAQHEHDVDDRQHDDEIRRAHRRPRRSSRRDTRRAPPMAAPSTSAPSTATSARPSDTRAPWSSRDSRSRPKLSAPRRKTGVAGSPPQTRAAAASRRDPRRSAATADRRATIG